jgi:Fic family protein
MAFSPNPLPHPINLDTELFSSLADASVALGELAGLARNIQNTSLLINPFMRREAVLSSRIEGTETGIADLYAFEAGQLPLPGTVPPPSENDRREVANYVIALQYGLDRLRDLPCSLRLIKEVHERLLTGVRGAQKTPGEFRSSQNWITGGGDRSAINATYIPPPVPEMHKSLDAFERYLHLSEGLPALVRLALIHYQFEAIHPFYDGNGRVGRLLILLLLVHWGLMPAPLLYLSGYFEENREEYYQRLLEVSRSGDVNGWVNYFLKGVSVQSRDATNRAKRLQDLQALWRNRLTGKRASTLGVSLADKLFTFPIVDVPFVAQTLGVTYQSAKNTVGRLVEAGILEEVTKIAASSVRVFWAAEVIRAVEGRPSSGALMNSSSLEQNKKI